jgi:hypothetical protein
MKELHEMFIVHDRALFPDSTSLVLSGQLRNPLSVLISSVCDENETSGNSEGRLQNAR